MPWIKVCVEANVKESCASQEDQGYEKCTKWGKTCTDWGWVPFSGAVCWAFDKICKATVWISKPVCIAWNYATTIVCIAWEVFKIPLAFIGFFLNMIWFIPVIGPLLKGFYTAGTGVLVGLGSGFVETTLCGWLGICPSKRMRVCVIIFSDKSKALTTEQDFKPVLDTAAKVFKNQANVSVHYNITTTNSMPDYALDVPCGVEAWVKDWWTFASPLYEETKIGACPFDSGANVVPVASTLFVYVVREVDEKNGCSLWLWSNFVTVEAKGSCLSRLGHEMGHACGLLHPEDMLMQDDPANLMHEGCDGPRNTLTPLQIGIIRGSKYVSYF
jgi:hypothetical protein